MITFVLCISWIFVAQKAIGTFTGSLCVSSCFPKLLDGPITPLKASEIFNVETSFEVTIFNHRVWQNLYMFVQILQTLYVLRKSLQFIPTTSSLKSLRNSEFMYVFHRLMFTICCWITLDSKVINFKGGALIPLVLAERIVHVLGPYWSQIKWKV